MTVDTGNLYPYAPVPGYGSEHWIFDEERALRDLMKGMLVSDHESSGQTRNVEAWFGHPDQELREQKYPYITIDLLQIQEGTERVHRGDYFFTNPPAWWGMSPLTGRQVCYLMEMPTPIDLDYQISTWARNPRHDRQILQQMITGNRTMMRAGLLWVSDGTNRRLDVLSHVKRDIVDANQKRLFNNVFRIRLSSQVPWGVLGKRAWNLDEVSHVRVKSGFTEDTDFPVQRSSLSGGTVLNWITARDIPRNPDIERIVQVDVDGYTKACRVARHVEDLLAGDEVIMAAEPLSESPETPDGYEYTVIDKRTPTI